MLYIISFSFVLLMFFLLIYGTFLAKKTSVSIACWVTFAALLALVLVPGNKAQRIGQLFAPEPTPTAPPVETIHFTPPDPTPYNIDTQRERDEQEEPNEDEWIPEFDFIMTPDSTAFSRIGYCEELWELMLTFRTTGDYVYHDIPPEVWEGLVAAESRGEYFQRNIKGNYDYERLD